ncbi:MAG: hemerythrin domain-containing protein [Calditrichaeota bacterium]|nr:hemerythrin domain-containing protein [Calditrichota bacterium]
MKPTESLIEEHRLILTVLEAAEREATRIEATAQVDHSRLEQLLDFFRSFADACHHRKEEEHLFKLLERKPPLRAPVTVMLQEHEMGRGFLRRVQEGLVAWAQGDPAGAVQVVEGFRSYAELLRAHIDKENQVLFPMADRVLTRAEQAQLVSAFERVEKDEIGEGVHEKYHRMAHELAERKP